MTPSRLSAMSIGRRSLTLLILALVLTLGPVLVVGQDDDDTGAGGGAPALGGVGEFDIGEGPGFLVSVPASWEAKRVAIVLSMPYVDAAEAHAFVARDRQADEVVITPRLIDSSLADYANTIEERRVLARMYAKAAIDNAFERLGLSDERPEVRIVAFHEGALVAADLGRWRLFRNNVTETVLVAPDVQTLTDLDVELPGAEVQAIVRPRSPADLARATLQLRELLGRRAVLEVIEETDTAADAGTMLRRAGRPPERYELVDTVAELRVQLEQVLDVAYGADIVIFGEQHAQTISLEVQHLFIEALGQRARAEERPAAFSTEMLERHEEAWVADEDAFERHRSDLRDNERSRGTYRLTDRAFDEGMSVIAANVPRYLAARVSNGGMEALDEMTEEERGWCADETLLDDAGYHERFFDTMMSMFEGGSHEGSEDVIEGMFRSQCLKDATMAESILRFVDANPGGLVFHVTGMFHSDYRQGTVYQLLARNPDLEIVTLTYRTREQLGVEDVRDSIDDAIEAFDATTADYLVIAAE